MPGAIQQLPPLSSGPPFPRKHFTRSEVERMLEAGLFAGQRFELIDGDLIDKIGQNPPHANAIQLCMAALIRIFGVLLVRVQLPIEAGAVDRDRSMPEPDLAVLVEGKPDFARRHPSGPEVALVVEVADTTARHDAGTKRDLYARAGIADYWVLDLNTRQLLVHRELDTEKCEYRSVQSYADDEVVSPGSRPGALVAVSSLLP